MAAFLQGRDRRLKGKPYREVAFRIMRPFVGMAFDEMTFRRLIAEAYTSFDMPEVAPLKMLDDSGCACSSCSTARRSPSRTWRCSCSAACSITRCDKRGEHATIVGATSGDTGSAAIEAVRDRKTIDIFMLHPHGRVSEVQRRQMTTVLAPNVHNIAVEGTFDDCQDLAKACFNDLAFRDRHALTAVNSINFARVMAQIVYYFWAALKARRAGAAGRLHRADGQFRQCLCRLRRQAHGPADRRTSWSAPTPTTSCRASSRPAP